MGLFDLFKSPEEKKKDEMMQKMHEQIFPGGFSQMENEIRQVRELLEYKYTKEDVKATYTQAAAIYFLARDKSQERIISSILLNKASVVTKSDAVKLYQFLQKKFHPHDVSRVISESDPLKLFLIAKGGIVQLQQEYKQLSNPGKYEAMILSSLLVLRFFGDKFPHKYNDDFQQEFHLYLIQQADSYKIPFTQNQLIDFINHRFYFYSEEIDQIYEGHGYIPDRLYAALYLTPLVPEIEHNYELGETVMFFRAYANMSTWLHTNIERMKI